MLNPLGNWKDKIVHEIETRIELIKLAVIERVSKLMGYFIFMLVCIFALVAIVVILGLAMGEYFAVLTDSYALGYLIAAGIYLLLFCILLIFRKPVVRMFAGAVVRLLTEDPDDE